MSGNRRSRNAWQFTLSPGGETIWIFPDQIIAVTETGASTAQIRMAIDSPGSGGQVSPSIIEVTGADADSVLAWAATQTQKVYGTATIPAAVVE